MSIGCSRKSLEGSIGYTRRKWLAVNDKREDSVQARRDGTVLLGRERHLQSYPRKLARSRRYPRQLDGRATETTPSRQDAVTQHKELSATLGGGGA